MISIGELASRARVPPSTIRYYERQGLLPAPARVGGKRRYDEDVELRLAAIMLAKQAGFSLKEIRRFLTGFSDSTPPSRRWQRMAERKLDELDRRAAEIERMRSVLQLGLRCDCLSLAQCRLVHE